MCDINNFNFEEIKEIIANAPINADTYVGGEIDYISMLSEGVLPRNMVDLRMLDKLYNNLLEQCIDNSNKLNRILSVIEAEPTSIYEPGLMGFSGKTEELSANQFKINLIKKLTEDISK